MTSLAALLDCFLAHVCNPPHLEVLAGCLTILSNEMILT